MNHDDKQNPNRTKREEAREADRKRKEEDKLALCRARLVAYIARRR